MNFAGEQMMVALELLTAIKKDSNKVDLLLPLQRIVIRELLKVEKYIGLLKKARSRLQKSKSVRRDPSEKHKMLIVKKLVGKCDERVKDYHHYRFLWRTIGDGIAFIYQSKYSLKHLYFDDDYVVKEESGFISGKAGFRNEYKALVYGLKRGIPIVLSDITNVIRHGDLCILAGEEPALIEMKSSKNRSARANRQIEQLLKLQQFFTNDQIENFRGVPLTIRTPFKEDDVNFEVVINEGVEKALATNGLCVESPEVGLRYFIFTSDWFENNHLDLDIHFGVRKEQSVIFNIVCDARMLPSYPFVLIFTPRNAASFIKGDFHIIVEIDFAEVKNKFKQLGLYATAILDGQCAVQVMLDASDIFKGVFRISEMLFGRVATEFLSLDWFIREQAIFAENFRFDFSESMFDEESLIRLNEWKSSKDAFEH